MCSLACIASVSTSGWSPTNRISTPFRVLCAQRSPKLLSQLLLYLLIHNLLYTPDSLTFRNLDLYLRVWDEYAICGRLEVDRRGGGRGPGGEHAQRGWCHRERGVQQRGRGDHRRSRCGGSMAVYAQVTERGRLMQHGGHDAEAGGRGVVGGQRRP